MATQSDRRVKFPVKQKPALDEGDLVEFSTTVEYRPKRGGTVWLKGGGTTSVRPGETPEEARYRLVTFVSQGVQEQLEALS